MAFAKEHGLVLTPPDWMRWRDANRQLQSLHGRQRAQATALQIDVNARHLSRDFFWSVLTPPAEPAAEPAPAAADAQPA